MHTHFTPDTLGLARALNQQERQAVLEELNRILADPGFKSSKRCVMLLGHLVHAAVEDGPTEFKERTLGIEVFGRSSDYDCQADPIVRMTATDIRKRLAQYYHERPAPPSNVIIGLTRGSYTPQFDFHGSLPVELPEDGNHVEHFDPTPVSHPEIEPPAPSQGPKVSRSKYIWLISAACIVLCLGTVAALYRYVFVRSQDMFWAPMLHSGQPLEICVADDPSLETLTDKLHAHTFADPDNGPGSVPERLPAIPFVEATAADQITKWFVAHNRPISLQRASTATLHIFRQGPAVLIGSFDNPWSLLLTSNLRYRVRMDPSTRDKWIEDSRNPSQRDWKVGPGLHFDDSYADYVLISRFHSSETQSWIAAISSLGPHGSRAASELITDSSLSKSLPRSIGSDSNVQIVLKTWVINGNSSAPQVLAIYTW